MGRVSREGEGGGAGASHVSRRESVAAWGGRVSAPVRCAHLRCVTATAHKAESPAGASLSNKIGLLV
jgi:hypothetical protein